MINNFNWIRIQNVLDRILRHPMLQEVTLEAAIQYTIDFIYTVGLPKYYIDKEVKLEVENYRAKLPCDLVYIEQVQDDKTLEYYRSMTHTFPLTSKDNPKNTTKTFKTQGNVIYTSLKDCKIRVAYKAIPIDQEGFPMLPDNPIFLEALELYIKKKQFTILFDLGKINRYVLDNTDQQYAFKVAQLNSEFNMPSLSEMETITNMMNQLITRTNEFNHGFKHLGNKEYIRLH